MLRETKRKRLLPIVGFILKPLLQVFLARASITLAYVFVYASQAILDGLVAVSAVFLKRPKNQNRLGLCMKSKKEKGVWFSLRVVRQQGSAFWIVKSQYSLRVCLSRRVAVHPTILPVAAMAVMSISLSL